METVYTIGHSVNTADEFIAMLGAQGVSFVIDVRSVPKSVYVPHFDREIISGALKNEGIEYVHMPELGGLRRAKDGWKSEGLEVYRSYMKTEEFDSAVKRIMEFAREKKVAIMCAEGMPNKCHRSLIADALVARGVDVVHIISETCVFSHEQTSLDV
ncbi:MAG: DUF488 domain-containing protein [archaeon]